MKIIEIGSQVGEFEDGVCPFSSGSQYYDWLSCNCDRCKKGATREIWETGTVEDIKCDIERSLSIGAITGRVPKEIARRMGFFENRGKYVWPCPEVEWTEEWKAEVLRRRSCKKDHS